MRRYFCGALFVAGLAIPVLGQQEKGDKEIAFQGTVQIPFENPGSSTVGTLIPRFGYFLTRRNFVGVENDNLFANGYQAAGVNLLYRFYMGARGSRFQPYVGVGPGFLVQREPVDVDILVTPASVSAAHNQINGASIPAATKSIYNQTLDGLVSAAEQGLFCTSITSSCQEVTPGTRNVVSRDFQGWGEFGIKFYLNRKFAFETSYRLLYIHESTLFADDQYIVTNATLTPTTYTVNFSGPTRHDGQQSGNLGFKDSSLNFLLFGFSYVF